MYLPHWKFNKQKNHRVSSFISGYRSFAADFSISIIASEIDTQEGRLVIQYQTNENPRLEFIQITYVIYPTQHDLYSFNQNINSNSPGTYFLTGAHDFSPTEIKYSTMVICRRGGQCPQN